MTLVVDELHTYRGTAGTEVAYLLRVLYKRLGLTPNSPQLRIIASSASLTDDESGLDYLEGFFGRDRDRFRVIGGDIEKPNVGAVAELAAHAPALLDLDQRTQGGEIEIDDEIARAFSSSVGLDVTADDRLPAAIMASALNAIRAPEAVRYACSSTENPAELIPRTPEE